MCPPPHFQNRGAAHATVEVLAGCLLMCVYVCVWSQLGRKALSLSQFGNELWTGGSAGRLSLFDASYGRYSLVEVCTNYRTVTHR